MIERESNKYNVSELLVNEKNAKKADNCTVLIGRLKGNINIGDKVYKVESKTLLNEAQNSYNKEFKKIPLKANILIKNNVPIKLHIETIEKDLSSPYYNLSFDLNSDIIPEIATNSPIDELRIINQFNKTGNTEYEFSEINVDLDNNLHIPSIGKLNQLRRDAIEYLENLVINRFTRKPINYKLNDFNTSYKKENEWKISLCLNILNLNLDYSKLNLVDNIYIPFKYFLDKRYFNIISNFKAKKYVLLPSIIRKNYKALISNNLNSLLDKFDIQGFVISNLSDLKLLPLNKNYEIIGNYTLNVFNNYTINQLNNLNINKITASPELSKLDLNSLPENCEFITYGSTPVMTTNYCLLGKSNHCYNTCEKLCMNTNEKYYIKDRMGFKFRIVPDNIETVTTIYNSKTTSISSLDTNFSSYRIDILDENIDDINKAIEATKSGIRLEGDNFTNGNFNRTI